MEFGVHLPNFPYGAPPSPEHMLRVAKTAEEEGYTSVWTSDHILIGASFPRFGVLYQTFVTLAWIAAQTSRIRIGTSILVLPMRNAILAAKQAATLDSLTGGRLILGVGVGWNEGEYGNLGADFKRRGRVLDESLAVWRNLFTSDRATFEGEFYRYRDGLFEPKPLRREGPPIWIGGQSEAALSRAASRADAWHGDDVGPGEFAEIATRLRADATKLGRSVGANVRLTVDMFDATGTARQGARPSGRVQQPDAGTLGLHGTFDSMRASARRYRDGGATDLICQFEHDTADQHVEFVRRFARDVVRTL